MCEIVNAIKESGGVLSYYKHKVNDFRGQGSALCGARRGLSDRPWAAAYSPLKTVHRTVFRALRIPGPFGAASLGMMIGKACLGNLSTAAAVPLSFQGRFG